MPQLDRRLFMLGAPLALAGCTRAMPDLALALPDFELPFGGGYGPRYDNGHPVASVDTLRVNSAYLRREVAYSGRQKAGTLVVDPPSRYLYLVSGGGRALRYGVGVGREGFAWSGVAQVKRKQVWPTWTPPAEMQRRRRHARGTRQSSRGSRAVPLSRQPRHDVSHSRHQRPELDRALNVERLHPASQPGHHRSL
jgi:hypothetical protein